MKRALVTQALRIIHKREPTEIEINQGLLAVAGLSILSGLAAIIAILAGDRSHRL